jgi:hypothetical protein
VRARARRWVDLKLKKSTDILKCCYGFRYVSSFINECKNTFIAAVLRRCRFCLVMRQKTASRLLHSCECAPNCSVPASVLSVPDVFVDLFRCTSYIQ